MRITGGGGESLDSTNTSFLGVASFEDRSATYVPFVRAFHRALAAANSEVLYRQGSSRAGHCLAIAVTGVLGLILVLGALLSLISFRIPSLLVTLALLYMLFPRLLRYVERNRPGRYDPGELPLDVLPV